MMEPLKLGLVGCGRIARLTHVHAIRQSASFQLVAVADPVESARTELAKDFPGIAAYSSPDDLLRHPGIQAVLIATPPATHVPIALAAIHAGLHVYVEKPLGLSVAEAVPLVATGRASGVVAMMGFNQRANPTLLRARSLVRSGRIGQPVLVRSVFGSVARDLPDWKSKRETGGGALLDLAPHHLDIVPWLMDTDITQIAADISSRKSEDDNARFNLRFANGAAGQIAVTMTGSEIDRIEIIGDRGILTVDRFAGQIEFRPAKRPRSLGERIPASLGLVAKSVNAAWRTLQPPSDPSYRESLEHFAMAIRGQSAVAGLDAGLRNLALIEAAEKSAHGGGAIQAVAQVKNNAEDTTVAGAGGVTDPRLSVVLVGFEGFPSVARSVEHLAMQTIAPSIEIIVIGPSKTELTRDAAAWAGRFHSIRLIEDNAIENVDVASASGLLVGRAPVLAIVEDHAFPRPDWAAAILKAHEGPYAAVGSAFRNANPISVLSWANLLMSYGTWSEPVTGGKTDSISRHNLSLKRSAIDGLHDLRGLLGRGGALLDAIKKNGGAFYLAPDAVVEHLNFSRLGPTLKLRTRAARVSASTRAMRENWPLPRRLIYVACTPLIPIMRVRPLLGKLGKPGPGANRAKLAAALLLGTVLDAVGQAIGFAFGPGDAADQLALFERGRERFLNAADRAMLAAPAQQ